MGCSACAKKRGMAGHTFEARFADGTSASYSTEREARAAVARKGGTYRRTA